MLLERLLGFDAKTMNKRTEVVAGATTFLTMCYILAVNPTVLSTTGMDRGALFTATAIASAIATLLLAFMAKLPFAQAPSMGLNAFFAYTLCQAMGYTWQQSLAIMLVEGIVFLLITFLNIREAILNAIPFNLRHAISVGIGMFIAFIGLKNAGIIVSSPATFVSLGKFTPTSILGVIAIILSGVLMARKVKGSLFYSIIIATLVGIPMGVTQIPDHWIPVSLPQSLSPIFCRFNFDGLLNMRTVMVVHPRGLGLQDAHRTSRRHDPPYQRGDDERCHRHDVRRLPRLLHADDLCGERVGHRRGRQERSDLAHDGHALRPLTLPLPRLPAHPRGSDQRSPGARGRANARLGEAPRPLRCQ